MKTRILWLMIFLVAILLGFESVSACSCVRRETCEFSATASAVFVGKVIDSKIEERNYRYPDETNGVALKAKFQVSRVEIKESFLGIENEKEIVIETDNFSSCFFSLEQGIEYVIYAHKDDKTGKYSTGFCSGTKPVQSGGEDLEYVRSQKNASGSTVKGFVAFNAKNKEHLFEIPQSNFLTITKLGISTVLLENKTDKYTAKIENDSTYNFQNVPKGKYNLSVILPKGYKTLDDYNPAVAKELGIELGVVDLTGFGCDVNNFTVVKTIAKKKRG